MTWFNTTTFNPMQAAQLRLALSVYSQQNPVSALSALQQLNQIYSQDAMFRGGAGFSPWAQGAGPTCGCIPSPQLGLSGAPAGRGLSQNPEGWPSNSVRTAGGYTVVAEGGTNWSIYGPNQKPGEKPMTRVWGDPHVDEKDGTRWDFTKNSDFVLPDGTRIGVQTSSQNGQSVSTGLNITNGADRVEIGGINGSPSMSAVKHDGYEWRAQHLAENPGMDTFRLGGNSDDVKWFRERNGQVDGLVTGAHYDGKTNRYEQNIEGGQKYWVSPDLQPPFGSPAWGNALRGEVTDQIGQLGLPANYRDAIAGMISQDHLVSEFRTAFGGLFGGGVFGGWDQGYGSVGQLGQLLLLQQLQAQSLSGHRHTNLWA